MLYIVFYAKIDDKIQFSPGRATVPRPRNDARRLFAGLPAEDAAYCAYFAAFSRAASTASINWS
jgi:hypothetical protein